MTDFTTHTIESAPADSKPLLEGAKAKVGFVPNLFANMAESPALLEGYLTLANIFGKTSFTETERQIVTMTSNRLNGCTYCMAAHTTISKGAGVPDDVIEALRDNTPIADTKLEALRQFSEVMVETRGWPSEAQTQAFLDAGWTKANILEVVLGTSLKVMSNYTNHAAATPLDDAFQGNAWSQTSAEAAE